jgi:hypothetical protein
MAYTYKMNDAKILLKSGKIEYRNDFFVVINSFSRLLCRLLFFSFAFIATWKIFDLYIEETIIANTITLGAIFATLGSVIVSVFTLYCSEQYNQFSDNSKILYEKLIGSTNWERWPFVKRISRYKIDKKQYESHILENPSIVFFGSVWSITIPLPASKADFYELPIYRLLFQLKRNRIIYRRILSLHQPPDALKELLLWDCLIGLYKNITLYRFGKAFLWFGGCFVFNSILFSLFYNSLMNILQHYL